MTEKPARHHHYVPQFYLRNFACEDKILVFNTETIKLFPSTPRNVAGERDLYLLEGTEPQLAEKMFGEIENALTPIFSKIISSEILPATDSDEFISLLSFIANMVMRHPRQFENIENFTRELMTKTIELHAHHSPAEGRKMGDGKMITKQELSEAVDALHAGKIKIHIPRDHSLGTSLGATESITETLLQRSWTLAITEDSTFITSSHPVILCWDQLDIHDRQSPGFGLLGTTVYFPISPKLMLIGKFEPLKERCVLDSRAVAAINGLHGIYSPQFLISQNETSMMQLGAMGTPQFKDLESVFKEFQKKESKS